MLLSTKPLSRSETARIVARAIEKIRRDAEDVYNTRRDLEPVLDCLKEEFLTELASLGVNLTDAPAQTPGTISFTPVDRAQVFAGYVSRNLHLFNSQGLKFQHGANGGVTFESRMQIGDYVTFYLQPWLHVNEEFGAARLATGYAKLTLSSCWSGATVSGGDRRSTARSSCRTTLLRSTRSGSAQRSPSGCR